MRYKSLLILVLIAYTYPLFAQVEVILDSTATNQSLLFKDISPVTNDSILPITKLPAINFYTDEWHNENTRSSYLIKKDATYILPLENLNTGHFVFPCDGKVCSPYGVRNRRMHTGMDIKQDYGDSIVAAWNGVVRMARMGYYGYGGTVIIRHDNGIETMYAHLSRICVLPNQEVKAGELIGKAGRTGRATTEHLHFETRFLYECFNPKTIINFDTRTLIADTMVVKNGKFFSKTDYDKKKNELDIKPTTIDSIAVDNIQTINDSILSKDTTPTLKTPIKHQTTYKPKYYTVKQGDTLSKIAKKYHTSINILCKINKIKETGILSLGQKIKLP